MDAVPLEGWCLGRGDGVLWAGLGGYGRLSRAWGAAFERLRAAVQGLGERLWAAVRSNFEYVKFGVYVSEAGTPHFQET